MIPEFTIRLICGLSMLWSLAPRAQITSGYYRIQMLLTLGLAVLFQVTLAQLPRNEGVANEGILFLAGLALSILSFLGSVFWTLERRTGGAVCGWLIVLVSSGLLAGLQIGKSAGIQNGLPSQLIEAFTSAWLVGAVTGTMLLGHWYLTATGMSLRPLIVFNRFFAAAALLRILVVVCQASPDVSAAASGSGLLILRWGGLVGPLALAFLVHRILAYRNTQSATGVLYAATILVFMGEMAAALLLRSEAIPPAV